MSPRLRPALRHAALLVAAGVVALLGGYAVLWYVPDHPLPAIDLRDPVGSIASRRVVLDAVVRLSGSTLVVLAAIGVVGLRRRGSARLRLALSYAAFLVAAGGVALLGVYVVLRYVPDYPLTAANPRDPGASVASRQEILDAVVGVSGAILAVLAVIGVGGGWLLAGWVLRPLQRINEAARIAAAGHLGHRIRLTGRNDEFRQLADSFDGMLGRLEEAFAAQERFAANASHELRTPLAVTATLLDVARRNPAGQDYPMLIDRLGITNARAIGLTEALLRLADAHPITATSELVNLEDIVRDAVAEHAGEAEQFGVEVDVRVAEAWTVGDATLLAQLASNLVQNAIRHNVRHGLARIATHHDRHRCVVSITVENTGASYAPDVAAQLSEPLVRGSGRVSQGNRETRGYGLGLALVSRIAKVHHGVLTIDPRHGGGPVITITFPASR